MLKTLLVIAIGFLPSLFSLLLMRKSRARARMLTRRNGFTSFPRQSRSQNYRLDNRDRLQHRVSVPSTVGETERYYLEGVGYLVGDISCQYNARSGYIRCAVNPSGPCDGCRFYEQREEVACSKQNF